MTLIGTAESMGWAFVFGDLMLTADTKIGCDATIPTLEDASLIDDCLFKWSIVGVVQKINVVSYNLAVGWSGSFVQAKELITNLRALASRDCYIASWQIIEYLRGNYHKYDDVCIMGIIADREKGFCDVIINKSDVSIECILTGLGKLKCCGSGAKLIEKFKDLVFTPIDTDMRDKKVAIHVLRNQFLSALGFLLSSDFADRDSIKNRCGGGYELITFLDNYGFVKVANISYVVWEFNEIEELYPLKLIYIQRQDYYNDVLVITSGHFNAKSYGVTAHNTVIENQIVPPVYRDISREEVEKIQIKHYRQYYATVAGHVGANFCSGYTVHIIIDKCNNDIAVGGMYNSQIYFRYLDGIHHLSCDCDTTSLVHSLICPEHEKGKIMGP